MTRLRRRRSRQRGSAVKSSVRPHDYQLGFMLHGVGSTVSFIICGNHSIASVCKPSVPLRDPSGLISFHVTEKWVLARSGEAVTTTLQETTFTSAGRFALA